MAAVALGLYLVFLLTAFGLRSYLQYRRTGSTGFLGISGRRGSAEWWGGALFVVAIFLGLAGPMVQLAGVPPLVDATWVHVCGLVLAIIGIGATVVAQNAMGTSWRVGVDQAETTHLVTSGPFALVRNPVFTTMSTAGIGLTLLAPNMIALAGLAALFVAIQLQVRVVEEPYLLGVHGEPYRDYAARVGRFVPGVGRLPVADLG